MTSIVSCSFKLKNLHEEAYALQVEFQGAGKSPISSKTFVFKPCEAPGPNTILDIYSQNGMSHPLFKKAKLFTRTDEENITAVSKKWFLRNEEGPSVVVLDLKDPKRSYKDKETIAKCELAFCSFLQSEAATGSGRAKNIHSHFKQVSLDHVLLEGSLKCDLLQFFSEEQAEYFLTHGKDFCQYAEFFMNAFKLGQGPREISAAPYFLPVFSKAAAFVPGEQSTVWYPPLYEQLYSPESSYWDVMKPIFSVSGSKDLNSGISIINVGRKV